MVNLTLPTPGTSSGAWGTIINQAFTDLNNGKADIANVVPSIAAPWTAYTPSWTSSGTLPALGNGTAVGYYNQIGKSVDFRFTLTFGSTSTFGTGNYYFSLPIQAAAGYILFQPFGWAIGTPAGSRNNGVAVLNNTSTIQVMQPGGASMWAPTYPGAWASANYIQITGRYEAA